MLVQRGDQRRRCLLYSASVEAFIVGSANEKRTNTLDQVCR